MTEQTAASWPYEAEQNHPLTALRIPVTNVHPDRWYLIAFDRDSEAQPTDGEAVLLASYLDYQRSKYTETWQRKMLAAPLDADPGHNTTIFHKWADDDWSYRMTTWCIGPFLSPPPPWIERKSGPLTLAALLDRINSYGVDDPMPGWTAWKSAHPDLFPPAAEEAGRG